MTLLLGALTIGLILSLLAMGVFVSFRIFDVPDITTDGSITLGAAIAAVLLANGCNPLLATALAAVGGGLAGSVTGVLHTKFKINALLSGILVMTALYSVNLHVMGRSNIPLMQARTLISYSEKAGQWMVGANDFNLLGWRIGSGDAAVLVMALLAAGIVAYGLYLFFSH